MSKKTKRSTIKNKLDKLFSIRVRSRGVCERCGKDDGTLQTSHIYSRSNLSVRWSEINAFCFCAGCHWWWHKNPLEAQEFTLEKLGKIDYNRLKREANSIKKWTDSQLLELINDLSD
jgi:hypothetical protein